MSYIIKSEKAKQAYDLLTVRPDGPFPTGYLFPDWDVVREVLLAVTCPVPCVGVVNETGWHLGCEARADAALAALKG